MDNANNLAPAKLGTLNGTGIMNIQPGNSGGVIADTGTFVVEDGLSVDDVTPLKGEQLIYVGPVEGIGSNVRIEQCTIGSVDDFPTITFSTSSGATFSQ